MNLYIAHVGFYDPDIGIYELHSNIFVVAANPAEAKKAVKSKEMFINKRIHIDGIQEISVVDGYKISAEKLEQQTHDNQTFGYDAVKALVE